MKYYKVCRLNNGELYSYIKSRANMYVDNVVEYKLGSFVFPKTPGHYLSVFKDYQSAFSFYAAYCPEYDKYKIYECEVEGICENPDFYTSVFQGNKKEGAVFVYGVKLIKEAEHVIKIGDVVKWECIKFLTCSFRENGKTDPIQWRFFSLNPNGVDLCRAIVKDTITLNDIQQQVDKDCQESGNPTSLVKYDGKCVEFLIS